RLKEILPGTAYTLPRRAYVDSMCNFSALPDMATSFFYLCAERLLDGVRAGDLDAIRQADGSLPDTMSRVIASPVYDSDIIRRQIQTTHNYFFASDWRYEPQLPSSRRHLSHYDPNRDFFNEVMLSIAEQPRIDLAHFWRVTKEFSRERQI